MTQQFIPKNRAPRNECTCLPEACTKMFTAVLFIIAPNWKQAVCSVVEWIDLSGCIV